MSSQLKRVAIYARYSSDHQKDASIEDQVRLCQEHCDRESWTLVKTYSDKAISGASLLRSGIQELLSDATAGRFDIILSEAMDRLSRDQEDIAGLYKRMEFAGVKIITLSEGEINNLHVGLKGTMNALFLKDLADKTRRGLRGRVEKGKSGGGNSYGYTVLKKLDKDGERLRGDRVINKQEALIITRIFQEYADGKSPRGIAYQLNADHIKGPRGRDWGQSTINGNRDRGTGILNNELYIGRLVWNRLRYLKNPDTGRRISRLNPEEEWITKNVPDLRILDQGLWDAVKARQGKIKHCKPLQLNNELGRYKRAKFLLSGLLKCGSCGGGFSMYSKKLVSCSTRRNKGTCDNHLTINRQLLESTVLDGLKNRLMEPAYFKAFCTEYTNDLNRSRKAQVSTLEAQRKEHGKIDKEMDKLVDALCEGIPAQKIKARMIKLEQRKQELAFIIENAKTPKPLLHPNMAGIYADKLNSLTRSLNDPEIITQMSDVLRSLIEAVVLIPVKDKLEIELVGDLAGILNFVALKEKGLISQQDKASQLRLVAGVGFEPTTFRL